MSMATLLTVVSTGVIILVLTCFMLCMVDYTEGVYCTLVAVTVANGTPVEETRVVWIVCTSACNLLLFIQLLYAQTLRLTHSRYVLRGVLLGLVAISIDFLSISYVMRLTTEPSVERTVCRHTLRILPGCTTAVVVGGLALVGLYGYLLGCLWRCCRLGECDADQNRG
jgi:hypothetical protein